MELRVWDNPNQKGRAASVTGRWGERKKGWREEGRRKGERKLGVLFQVGGSAQRSKRQKAQHSDGTRENH